MSEISVERLGRPDPAPDGQATLDRIRPAEHEEPRVFDTYSLVYAFSLLFLLPGVTFMLRLPFGDDRASTYTFAYVSLVTVPFVLGMLATFLTDSSDPLKRVLLRCLVLVPLTIMAGVTIMFGSSILIVPVSRWIVPENFATLTWVSAALLALVAAPMVVALVRRVRGLGRIKTAVQSFALLAAIGLVAAVVVATVAFPGALGDAARKDAVIYVVGAMTWYLPSFGLAAGIWRRLGLV